jgi:hypothetical protein
LKVCYDKRLDLLSLQKFGINLINERLTFFEGGGRARVPNGGKRPLCHALSVLEIGLVVLRLKPFESCFIDHIRPQREAIRPLGEQAAHFGVMIATSTPRSQTRRNSLHEPAFGASRSFRRSPFLSPDRKRPLSA